MCSLPMGLKHGIIWFAFVFLFWLLIRFLPVIARHQRIALFYSKMKHRTGLMWAWIKPCILSDKWSYFGQLCIIFVAVLFALYGFYALIYSRYPCCGTAWHFLFGLVFPKLNVTVLNSIPYLEIGITFYAGGTLLLNLFNKTPFPEWNPYDLQHLTYTRKSLPCATVYLSALFFCSYTGTYRLAFLCIFALFFTYLKAICFEHDLTKEAVREKLIHITINRVKAGVKSSSKGQESTCGKKQQTLSQIYDEVAMISNHSIAQIMNAADSVPIHYSQYARDVYTLFHQLMNELIPAKFLFGGVYDSHFVAFTIGYALLGYANQQNTDLDKMDYYLSILSHTFRMKMSEDESFVAPALFGLALRRCVYNQKYEKLHVLTDRIGKGISKKKKDDFYRCVYSSFLSSNPCELSNRIISDLRRDLGNTYNKPECEKIFKKPMAEGE